MSDDVAIDIYLPADFAARALESDVRRGLTSSPKVLPPKWFYDKVGSELFEEITELPEYYPTRAEAEILTAQANAIAEATAADTLIELGSGSSTKTRLLLDALRDQGTLQKYVALDVSAPALEGAAGALALAYPGLQIHGLVADFDQHLNLLKGDGARLLAFLGGTIGNFDPQSRAAFLGSIADQLGPDDHFLLGTDLVKSPSVLIPAYDDSRGVTAAFNRNVLAVINREMDANFDVEAFDHIVVWDDVNEWIEMRLRAARSMSVDIGRLALSVSFDEGEELRTEISAKFRQESLEAEMAAAGFAPVSWWTDSGDRFGLSLWQSALR
jgi:L-histidine Nalpha-methyltransferase